MTNLLAPSQRCRILVWGMLLGVVGIAIVGRWPRPPENVELPPTQPKQSIKIGLVNMERVYREYHKTREHEAELEEEKSKAKNDVDELISIWEQLRDDFNTRKIISQTGDAEVTALNESKDVITSYTKDRQGEIEKMLQGLRAEILADLHSLVERIASEEGYGLVFDSSGKSTTGVELMLFSRTGIDLTETVMARANPSTKP